MSIWSGLLFRCMDIFVVENNLAISDLKAHHLNMVQAVQEENDVQTFWLYFVLLFAMKLVHHST